MNKYLFGKIVSVTIITTIMFSYDFGIRTWQFWLVYLSAWAMAFFQYLEDFNG